MRKQTLLLIPALLWLLPVGCDTYDPEASSGEQKTLREATGEKAKPNLSEIGGKGQSSLKNASFEAGKQHSQQDRDEQTEIKEMLAQQGVSDEQLKLFMISKNLDWEYVVSNYLKTGAGYVSSLKQEIETWLQSQNWGMDKNQDTNNTTAGFGEQVDPYAVMTTGQLTYTPAEEQWNRLITAAKENVKSIREEIKRKEEALNEEWKNINVTERDEKTKEKKKLQRSYIIYDDKNSEHFKACIICKEGLGTKPGSDNCGSGIFNWPCKHQSCVTCAENWMKILIQEGNPISCPLCGHSDPFWVPNE